MNKEQQRIVDSIQYKNIFLTGAAGCGKTYTIIQIEKKYKELGKRIAITGTTAIAAQNYEYGSTLHSFAALPVHWQPFSNDQINKDFENYFKNENPTVIERLKNIDLLVIDEVSMLDAGLLELLNKILKKVRGNDHIFGKCRLLIAGDFYQLPPVAIKEKIKLLFDNPLWKTWKFKTIVLETNFRQIDDKYFLENLQQLRLANLTGRVYKFFETLRVDSDIFKPNILRVFFTNKQADEYNEERLNNLKSKEITFESTLKLYDNYKMQSNWPFQTPPRVVIKKGARIMITRNLPDLGLINGDMAKIIKVNENDNQIHIMCYNKKGEKILPLCVETITNSNNNNKLAEVLGFPLRIAYGLTVHKVQGLTLDKIILHLKSVQFVPHLLYVALSRVKKAQDLHIVASKDFLKNVLDDLFVLHQVDSFYLKINSNNNNIIDFSSDDEVDLFYLNNKRKKTKYI